MGRLGTDGTVQPLYSHRDFVHFRGRIICRKQSLSGHKTRNKGLESGLFLYDYLFGWDQSQHLKKK
jgi:hypothetical protein